MAGRGRPKKDMPQAILVQSSEVDELENMPLETFQDYELYNKKCRKLGIPIKVPPIHMHKHVKCKVTRLDGQGSNAIRIRKRNQKIDFDQTIMPGQVVELPDVIVDFLHELVYPQYKELKKEDGTSETVWSHDLPRFAVQVLERAA